MLEMSRKFKNTPMTPADTATYWVEYIARHGKDALRSPVMDLPWWQVYLVDIYGFILLVILIVCWIIKVTVKLLISCIIASKKNTASHLKKKIS